MMEILEPHINSGLGVALKAHNGEYVSFFIRTMFNVTIYTNILTKATKDAMTKFVIEKVDNNTIRLKAHNNKYVSRVSDKYPTHLRADSTNKDVLSLFDVYEDGGKLVLKSQSNGLFVSVIQREATAFVEAGKRGIDESCRFVVETGSVTPVSEQIMSVTMGELSNPQKMRPSIAATRSVSNRAKRDVTKTVALEWSHTKTQETNWERGWGITTGLKLSSSFGIKGLGSVDAEVSLEINANGKKGGNAGTSTTTTFTETTTLNVAPNTKMTTQLIVQKDEAAEIPFTAIIRRTSELGQQEFEERGVWRGVMVFKTMLEVTEERL